MAEAGPLQRLQAFMGNSTQDMLELIVGQLDKLGGAMFGQSGDVLKALSFGVFSGGDRGPTYTVHEQAPPTTPAVEPITTVSLPANPPEALNQAMQSVAHLSSLVLGSATASVSSGTKAIFNTVQAETPADLMAFNPAAVGIAQTRGVSQTVG